MCWTWKCRIFIDKHYCTSCCLRILCMSCVNCAEQISRCKWVCKSYRLTMHLLIKHGKRLLSWRHEKEVNLLVWWQLDCWKSITDTNKYYTIIIWRYRFDILCKLKYNKRNNININSTGSFAHTVQNEYILQCSGRNGNVNCDLTQSLDCSIILNIEMYCTNMVRIGI